MNVPRERSQPTVRAVAAVLTPPGRGAVATIQVTDGVALLDAVGPTLFRSVSGRSLAEQPINRLLFGHWGPDPAEEVVVCRTDERTLEIHCHGGAAAVRRILGDLQTRGIATNSEASRLSLEQECRTAVTQATTLRTADLLLEQSGGILRTELEELRHVPWTSSGQSQLAERLDALLSWSQFGLHLTTPWSVVLLGRPNVGKSSLTNALLGYARSIVFDQPGTTRDVVTGETAFDGWPVQLADTAGIRLEADALEAAGIDLARRRLESADCRVLLLDASQPPQPEDWRLLTEWPDAIRVAHKADLPEVWGDQLPADVVRVSSRTGTGLEELIATIVHRLVPRVPPPGTPIPITARQVALLTAARAAVRDGDQQRFLAALEGLT